MRYSFTGPSRLTEDDEALVAFVVAGLAEPTEITTGGATGWDTEIARAALYVWPDVLHRIVTPGAKFNLAGVTECIDIARREGVARFEVVTLPEPFRGGPSAAYRERNRMMVEACDVLCAAVRSSASEPRFYRSGEWMTVNLARSLGRPVQFTRLAPS